MEQTHLWARLLGKRTQTYTQPVPQPLPPPQPAPYPGTQSQPELESWLSDTLGKPVELTWTKNRSTMLSYRHRGEILALRLHRMFSQAGHAEMLAVVRYLGGGTNRRANRILDDFIAEQARFFQAPRAQVTLRPQGRIHDLGEIFAELNAAYFHTGCTAAITWSLKKPRRARRSITLGCYSTEQNLIRLHPCLDQAFVPRFYVTGVVFHEMLHEVFGIARHAGRRVVHPPEFVAVEESHPDFERCKAWEAANLSRLLRYKPPAESLDG